MRENSLAQAKTGTGKTMAFLLPTIQKILDSTSKLEESNSKFRSSNKVDVRALIISPTRELALQIADEAEKLIRHTNLAVQSAVGGTGKREAMYKMRREGCHILVATPGRLLDILQDTRAEVNVSNLEVFVLDEADSLLDQGFSAALKSINQVLPDRKTQDRQTLLYSATLSGAVREIAKLTLKPTFAFVNTIDVNEKPTHDRVPQKVLPVRSMENVLPTLLELVQREMAIAKEKNLPFKAMVFANTTRSCTLNAEVFRRLKPASHSDDAVAQEHPLGRLTMLEIHGRLSQERRTIMSARFKLARDAILFTSDVSARGMDFPNVTHIIQVGVPMSREAYIHRLGRTARGSSTTTGKGFLILSKCEYGVGMRMLSDLPITGENLNDGKTMKELKCMDVDMGKAITVDRETAEVLTMVTEAAARATMESKEGMYLAMLGFYSTNHVPIRGLIEEIGRLCRYQWGMEKPVPVSRSLVTKLGIAKHDILAMDLNIGSSAGYVKGGDADSNSRFSDRGGGGYGDRPRGGYGDRSSRSNSFSSGSSGFGDRPPRRDFGDRPPRRDFGDRPPRGDFGDRPPRRDFGDRPPRGDFGDRPPRRDFGDRPPRRDFDSDRSISRADMESRSPRSEFGGSSTRSSSLGDLNKVGERGDHRLSETPTRSRSVDVRSPRSGFRHNKAPSWSGRGSGDQARQRNREKYTKYSR